MKSGVKTVYNLHEYIKNHKSHCSNMNTHIRFYYYCCIQSRAAHKLSALIKIICYVPWQPALAAERGGGRRLLTGNRGNNNRREKKNTHEFSKPIFCSCCLAEWIALKRMRLVPVCVSLWIYVLFAGKPRTNAVYYSKHVWLLKCPWDHCSLCDQEDLW